MPRAELIDYIDLLDTSTGRLASGMVRGCWPVQWTTDHAEAGDYTPAIVEHIIWLDASTRRVDELVMSRGRLAGLVDRNPGVDVDTRGWYFYSITTAVQALIGGSGEAAVARCDRKMAAITRHGFCIDSTGGRQRVLTRRPATRHDCGENTRTYWDVP